MVNKKSKENIEKMGNNNPKATFLVIDKTGDVIVPDAHSYGYKSFDDASQKAMSLLLLNGERRKDDTLYIYRYVGHYRLPKTIPVWHGAD